MYCLVRFVDDGIYYVTPKRGLTAIGGGLVWAPYKRLGFYEAVIVTEDINRKILVKEQEKLDFQRTHDYVDETANMHDDKLASDDSMVLDCVTAANDEHEERSNERGNCIGDSDEHQHFVPIGQLLDSGGDYDDCTAKERLSHSNNEKIRTPASQNHYINETSNLQDKVATIDSMDCVTAVNDEYEDIGNETDNSVDDSDEDPHYIPEGSSGDDDDCNDKESETHSNYGKVMTASQNRNNNSGLHANYSKENESIREVPISLGPKKYCCIYCNGLYSKLVKHLEHVHKTEVEVRMFMSLPSKGEGSRERKSLIANIRNKGSYLNNTDPRFNSNQLIVTRRPSKRNTDPNYYRMCPQCRGLFSKKSIRKHYKICMPGRNAGDRSTAVLGRQIYGKCHTKACHTLKDEIFPVIRDDEISNIIRYDELIILFGNSLCSKYRSKHFHKMIRSKLRLLGRLMRSMKSISHVADFASIYNIHLYDNILKATNDVALLNEDGDKYKSPATASSIGTLLKKCGKLFITECIKKGDKKRQTEVEDFLKVIEEEFGTSINRIALENQKQIKRLTRTSLPSMRDISHLYEYVRKNEKTMYIQLQKKFDFNTWKNLASFTLSAIQIFNRRRSGEIERMLIAEFYAHQSIDNEDPDLILNLNEEDEIKANRYVRCTIRGKLARGVPVLLDKETVSHIEIILSSRKEAGVSVKNLYVFGLPHSKHEHYHLDACKLLRTFSNACGATNPESLRGTKLRKKLCTQSAALNLHDNAVSDLANFMGHADKIHHDHYRLPIISRDIARVSNILEIGVSKSFNITADETNGSNNNSPSQLDANNNSGEDFNRIDKIFQYENEDNRLDNSNDSENGKCLLHETPENYDTSDSPYRVLKRRSWTTPEKYVVMKAFKSNVEMKQLPSLRECSDLIIDYEHILQNRTPSQIKTWVSNKMKESETKKSRVYWSTEEKLIMRKEFFENLKNNILPPLVRCEEVRTKHKVLNSRSAKVLKAWVYNQTRQKKY